MNKTKRNNKRRDPFAPRPKRRTKFQNGHRVVWSDGSSTQRSGLVRDASRVGGQVLYEIKQDGEPLPVEVAEVELSLEPAPRLDTRYTVKVENLTLPECELEKDSLDHWFISLRDNQEGFSSKDCIRYRDVCERLRKLTNGYVQEMI